MIALRSITPKYKYTYLRYNKNNNSIKGSRYSLDQTKIIFISKNHFKSSPEQAEVIRRALNKTIKRAEGGVIDLRIFPQYACSKKPLQSRMGKGKGKHSHFITPIHYGTRIIGITPTRKTKLRPALRKIRYKIPTKLKKIVIDNNVHWCSELSTQNVPRFWNKSA